MTSIYDVCGYLNYIESDLNPYNMAEMLKNEYGDLSEYFWDPNIRDDLAKDLFSMMFTQINCWCPICGKYYEGFPDYDIFAMHMKVDHDYDATGL